MDPIHADISGMLFVRLLINAGVIALAWAIILRFAKGYCKKLRENDENRTVAISITTLLVYFWVLVPIEGHFDEKLFVFIDYGSWFSNFAAYYARDWVYRLVFTLVLGLTGGSLFLSLGGVWPKCFAANAKGFAEKTVAWTMIIFCGWIVSIGILTCPYWLG